MSILGLEQTILNFVQTSFHELEQSKKYGGTVLIAASGTLIGGVFAYEKHISIEFSNGYLLQDSGGKLQGSGKFRRHLKIQSMDDIDWSLLEGFISESLLLLNKT